MAWSKPVLRGRAARAAAWLACAAALATGSALARPVLHCQIEQGYKTYVQEVMPTDDPYGAVPLEVRGRFRFKAVVFAEGPEVEYVKLYAYYYLRGQPVLIHMAQHDRPVVTASDSIGAMTGMQRVISPRLGHEMRYQCALRDTAP